jgi:hypothetical protein
MVDVRKKASVDEKRGFLKISLFQSRTSKHSRFGDEKVESLREIA